MYFKQIVFFLLLACAQQVLAQPLEKSKRSVAFWAEQQFYTDTITKPHWFVETQFRYSTLQNNERNISSSFPFYRFQLMVGKLWIFNQNWGGGLSARPVFEKNRTYLFSRGFLQHTGRINNTRLLKRLSFEYISDSNTPAFYWARTAGFIEIEKPFYWKNQPLFTSVSYEFFLNHRTESNPIPEENERLIDRSRLRLNMGIAIKNWLISLFVLRETDYFFAQEVFDENGELKKPFRKLNLLTPTYGVSLRYIWQNKSE